jgi:hypothetical protein
MIIAIIRGSISGPPAVLAAHLIANMSENIALLHFLNLFLVLPTSSCDARELHVSLWKYRTHLVLPY